MRRPDRKGGAPALPPDIADQLAEIQRARPPVVKRSTKRDPQTRSRSLELDRVLAVDGGFYLPIYGFCRPRRSTKPMLYTAAGFVTAGVVNLLIAAFGVGSVINYGVATALIIPPFIGLSYKARALDARPSMDGAFTPGILALEHALVLSYADGPLMIERSRIREVVRRKTVESPRDKSQILVIHELVIGVIDNHGLPAQVIAWRLIEHPGTLDTDVDVAVAIMPAIAEQLQTRWLGLASIVDS